MSLTPAVVVYSTTKVPPRPFARPGGVATTDRTGDRVKNITTTPAFFANDSHCDDSRLLL